MSRKRSSGLYLLRAYVGAVCAKLPARSGGVVALLATLLDAEWGRAKFCWVPEARNHRASGCYRYRRQGVHQPGGACGRFQASSSRYTVVGLTDLAPMRCCLATGAK